MLRRTAGTLRLLREPPPSRLDMDFPHPHARGVRQSGRKERCGEQGSPDRGGPYRRDRPGWKPVRLQQQPFFEDKNRAFWILQSAGWAGYFILRTLSGIANSDGLELRPPHRPADRDRLFDHPADGGGLSPADQDASRSITWVTLDRHRARRRRPPSRRSRPGATPPSSGPGVRPEGLQFLGAILLTFALLVAWSALYYSINYYLLLEEQTDRLLRLEHQASSAPSWRCCATSSTRISCSTP